MAQEVTTAEDRFRAAANRLGQIGRRRAVLLGQISKRQAEMAELADEAEQIEASCGANGDSAS